LNNTIEDLKLENISINNNQEEQEMTIINLTSIIEEMKILDYNKEQEHMLKLEGLNNLKVEQEKKFIEKLKDMEKRKKDSSEKEFD